MRTIGGTAIGMLCTLLHSLPRAFAVHHPLAIRCYMISPLSHSPCALGTGHWALGKHTSIFHGDQGATRRKPDAVRVLRLCTVQRAMYSGFQFRATERLGGGGMQFHTAASGAPIQYHREDSPFNTLVQYHKGGFG
jgi:hypothetical protein